MLEHIASFIAEVNSRWVQHWQLVEDFLAMPKFSWGHFMYAYMYIVLVAKFFFVIIFISLDVITFLVGGVTRGTS